jgi:hypothetical protein
VLDFILVEVHDQTIVLGSVEFLEIDRNDATNEFAGGNHWLALRSRKTFDFEEIERERVTCQGAKSGNLRLFLHELDRMREFLRDVADRFNLRIRVDIALP